MQQSDCKPSACATCPSRSACKSSRPVSKISLRNLKVVMIMAGKGGVGKSTMAASLAVEFALLFKKESHSAIFANESSATTEKTPSEETNASDFDDLPFLEPSEPQKVALLDLDLTGPSQLRLTGSIDKVDDFTDELWVNLDVHHTKELSSSDPNSFYEDSADEKQPTRKDSDFWDSFKGSEKQEKWLKENSLESVKLTLCSPAHSLDHLSDSATINPTLLHKYLSALMTHLDKLGTRVLVVDVPPGIEDETLGLVGAIENDLKKCDGFAANKSGDDLNFSISQNPPVNHPHESKTSQSLTLASQNLLNVVLSSSHTLSTVLLSTDSYLSKSDLLRHLTFCKKSEIPVLGVVQNMAGLECSCGTLIDIFGASESKMPPENDENFELSEKATIDYLQNLPLENICEQKNLSLIAKIPLRQAVARCGDEGVIFRV